MRAIFISYRRDDSEGEAGRLFDDLVAVLGENSVFMDVAAIEVGRDFRRAIDDSVATCGVLLAIIGKNWIDAEDEAGRRRLDNPSDFVRLETASALKRDIPVVPVLVHGAKMPRLEQLPEDIRELAYRNGVELTHARWNSDLQLLIKALRPHVEERKDELAGDSPKSKVGVALEEPLSIKESPSAAVSSDRARTKRPRIIFAFVLALLLTSSVVAYMKLAPRQVTVPDLRGNTLPDAVTKLNALNLSVGQQTRSEDPTRDSNVVLSQSPSPNSRVSKGSMVDLVISQPPKVSTQLVEIPELTGKSLNAAQRALADRRLQVGNVERMPKTDVPRDTVLQEFPAAGEKVKAASKVDLMVSDIAEVRPPDRVPDRKALAETDHPNNPPRMVVVPDLTNTPLMDAEWKLQEARLSVGTIRRDVNSTAPRQAVVRQEPAAGQQVEPGSPVNLVVSFPRKSTSASIGASIGRLAGATARTAPCQIIATSTPWTLPGTAEVFIDNVTVGRFRYGRSGSTPLTFDCNPGQHLFKFVILGTSMTCSGPVHLSYGSRLGPSIYIRDGRANCSLRE